ncbi:bifunctional nuclease family protein [Enorma phocaeensis]|uniref:bifunctional nuclease family protein n=1 Tax=Enorma phocaeensis TaxID=1871019 RepID=UPI00320AB724
MIRVDIETIIMASGPVPSVIVLRERSRADGSEAPLRTLSIQTGSFEAAAISRGIDGSTNARPITHDLFVDALQALGAHIERIEISRVDAPVFYSKIVLVRRDEDDAVHEVALDARPSDAIALAVRCNAPIYVEDDVMNRAGTVSYRTEQTGSDEEVERFDRFVQTLSPDDF